MMPAGRISTADPGKVKDRARASGKVRGQGEGGARAGRGPGRGRGRDGGWGMGSWGMGLQGRLRRARRDGGLGDGVLVAEAIIRPVPAPILVCIIAGYWSW